MLWPTGQNQPVEMAPSELMLARASDTPTRERSQGDQQKAYWQRQNKPLPDGIGQEQDLTRQRNEGAVEREQKYSGLRANGLVCPGCGCSGVRGGVRCNSGGAEANNGEPLVQQHEPPKPEVGTNHINQAALHMLEDETVDVSAGSRMRKSGRCSTPLSSPAETILSSTDGVSADVTFHTSLGVLVDICTWRQQDDAEVVGAVRGDKDGENIECSPNDVSGEDEREQLPGRLYLTKSWRETLTMRRCPRLRTCQGYAFTSSRNYGNPTLRLTSAWACTESQARVVPVVLRPPTCGA